MPPRRPTSPTPPPVGSPEMRQATDAPASGGFASPTAPWPSRDMLIPYVLLAVSLQRAHGYLIEEYLKGLGFFSLEMSTLYRTLRQLEKDGLPLSTWEPGPAGPARRVYTLSDAGRAWLDSGAVALEGYRAMIDRFFGLYGDLAAADTTTRKKEGKRPK
jgi:PadR family transcriptional regulator, regulatory protein PadR